MKKEIRRYFLNFKHRLPEETRQAYDKKILENILESDLYKDANSIFVYLSRGFEIDTRFFIDQALKDGKTVCVPKIKRKMVMDAVVLETIDDLVMGDFDIETTKKDQVIESPDLTLVPGLCFDDNKHRIGFGGGYYDNYLANHDSTYLGMFYSQSKIDKIPDEDHDQALDYIVTENGIF